MNIFLITSVPMVPPWDQGDKNLAYMLTGALPQHHFRILTARDEPTPIGANLDRMPIYRTKNPSLAQKAHVYWHLLARSATGPFLRPVHDTRTASPKRSSADLYHLIYRPYPLSSRLLTLLPELQRHPTVHTIPATADGQPLSRDLFFADRIVVLSEHGRQLLQRLGTSGVVHIPPGVDVSRWAVLQDRQDQMKSHLGLSKEPVVLFPGHYGPGQGADVVLRALPHIVAHIPKVRLIFACRTRSSHDEARERVALQTIAQMGLARSVYLYNTVADMRALIGACDLVVLPLETMRDKIDIPTTLLESLAARKPIIISDLAPMNELLHRSADQTDSCAEVGAAVPPGDADALAQAVTEMMRDNALRLRMGKRGQEMVRDCFDIRRVADQYDELYQEMAPYKHGQVL